MTKTGSFLVTIYFCYKKRETYVQQWQIQAVDEAGTCVCVYVPARVARRAVTVRHRAGAQRPAARRLRAASAQSRAKRRVPSTPERCPRASSEPPPDCDCPL